MIDTVNTKQQQLTSGYFKIGTGSEIILFIGSCRTVPYLGYFNLWNEQNGNRFTICFIDPFNWHYDLQDNRIDLEAKINSLETDENILNLLKSTTICIHEFYSNFGMFNFDKSAAKNIYQFGLNPAIDICIPNFNDLFILLGDIVSFYTDIRKKAIADYNVIGKLSAQTLKNIFELSSVNVLKFLTICMKSDIPEMSKYFMNNFRHKRFHHNSNHVSKHFTLAIFNFINDKFLHLELSKEFIEAISENDMFDNSFTELTEYDVAFYNYDWGESIVPLKKFL